MAAETMQLLNAASADVPLRDQTCRSAHVTRRQSAIKPVASLAFARLAKGLALALALAVMAGIAAAPCSAAADGMSKASRQTSIVAAPSSPVMAGRQRILAHQDPDSATTYVEKLYEQLMRSTPP